MIHPPPKYTLFPYTTLFRSRRQERQNHAHRELKSHELSFQLQGSERRQEPQAEHPAQTRRHRHCSVGIERSEEHTSELQSLAYLVCRLLLEKKNKTKTY